MLANFPYRAGRPPAQITHPEGLISVKKIFKWLALLLGYFFLAVFWQLSQNGRYLLRETGQGTLVIDTRTGDVSWANPHQQTP